MFEPIYPICSPLLPTFLLDLETRWHFLSNHCVPETVLSALSHSCISPAAALGGSGQGAQLFAKAHSR